MTSSTRSSGATTPCGAPPGAGRTSRWRRRARPSSSASRAVASGSMKCGGSVIACAAGRAVESRSSHASSPRPRPSRAGPESGRRRARRGRRGAPSRAWPAAVRVLGDRDHAGAHELAHRRGQALLGRAGYAGHGGIGRLSGRGTDATRRASRSPSVKPLSRRGNPQDGSGVDEVDARARSGRARRASCGPSSAGCARGATRRCAR